jgi:hypothetical protein
MHELQPVLERLAIMVSPAFCLIKADESRPHILDRPIFPPPAEFLAEFRCHGQPVKLVGSIDPLARPNLGYSLLSSFEEVRRKSNSLFSP